MPTNCLIRKQACFNELGMFNSGPAWVAWFLAHACCSGLGTPRDLVEAALRAIWEVHRLEGLVSAPHLTTALHTIAGNQSCQVGPDRLV